MQSHKRLTLEQYDRFNQFHQDWTAKNISDSESIDNLWLKTHRLNPTNEKEHFLIQSTISNSETDLNQPPYHHYRQYKIIDPEKKL